MKDTHPISHFFFKGYCSFPSIMRRIFLSLLVFLIFGIATFPVKAQGRQTIRVGVYENAPKIFTSADGVVSGFWPDLIRYIAAEQRWEIKWVHGTWEEGLERLANNEIDILPDLSWSPKRSEIYTFSNEVVLVSWSRIYVQQGSSIETILELDGKTIAGLERSANMDGPEGIKELARRFDIQVTFVELGSYTEVFQALENGEVDAGVTNKDFGNLNENLYHIDRTPIIFRPSSIMFGFTQDAALTPFLVDVFDKRINTLKKENTSFYYQILDKWLGVQYPDVFFLPLWVRWIFLIALALFAFFSIFSLLLRQQVREKTYTLRKYAGELSTLNTVSSALSSSLKLDKVLAIILEQIGEVLPLDSGTIFLYQEDELCVVIDRGISPSLKGSIFTGESDLFKKIQQTGKPLILSDAKSDTRFDNWGQNRTIKSWMGIPLLVRDTLIGFLTLDSLQLGAYALAQTELAKTFASQAAQAISNARQFNATQQRIGQLDSLREIDQAIANNVDLQITLDTLLEHVLAQLNVDAARVFCYNKDIQTLIFSQSKGFRGEDIQHTDLRLGYGLAGEVALRRDATFISDLHQPEVDLSASPEFEGEGFFAYRAVPLLAKDILVGILEVFHRSPHNPTREWRNFLQVLAGQAAIAIDHIALFDDLQRSHKELALAYNATIEGWAQALELRDMETEGHSRRVVKMTMKLAEMLNLNEQEILNIRRGALLHDIGKMGVPDAILQKTEKLTSSEWDVMRLHPGYAYEWLSPIEYLRPALDIPYCHHEKWNGTGYPRGLKGKQIPIAARLFAVIDVWDALRSNRPYRKMWSKEKVLAYIQKESGKHFDPEMVDTFMIFIKSEGN